MPAFQITDVDTVTNQLEIVGHGLATGAGPAAVRNTLTSTGLPAPIAPVSDYWLIVDDADHVRLATSLVDALAGTAVDLTTSGTGTQVLEIGIPYRRASTYVPSTVDTAGSRVNSADLNALQDANKALHALLTGQAQSIWSVDGENAIVVPFAPYAFATAGALNQPAVFGSGYVRKLTAGSVCIAYLPSLRVGWNLTKVGVLADGAFGGFDIARQVYNAQTSLSPVVSSIALAGGTMTFGTLPTPELISNIDQMVLTLSVAADRNISHLVVYYDPNGQL